MRLGVPTVGIVDHGMGNLRSVAKAIEVAGARVVVESEPRTLSRVDRICVPGQGIFGRCMDALSSAGLSDFLRDWVTEQKPYLGICLGLQVLFDTSEEQGPVGGLGVLSGKVERLKAPVIPHIGWNTVDDTYYYFDHSFVVAPEDRSIVTGWTEHGTTFPSIVATGSILGVQFHPEKSGQAGIDVLEQWIGDIAVATAGLHGRDSLTREGCV